MGIYRGTDPLKAYRGDMQPVNVYRGSTKVAGWHSASYSGQSPLAVDCDYNVPPDALTVDGKCSQVQGCWGTNLVTNGDFSNGMNGWLHSKGSFSIVNGVAQVLSTEQGGQIFHGIENFHKDHSYYCAALVMSETTSVVMYLELYSSPWTMLGAKRVSKTGSANRISFVTNKSSSDIVTTNLIVRDESASSWETFTVDDVILIDLTSAFGAGKEPTAAQMDAIMAQFPNSWFDGSARLSTDTTKYTPNSPGPSFPAPISTITGNATITGADGAESDTVTVALGSAVCASLPDGTHDSYDAVTGVLTKRVGKATTSTSGTYVTAIASARTAVGLSLNPAGVVGAVTSVICSRFPTSASSEQDNLAVSTCRLSYSGTPVWFFGILSEFPTDDALLNWLKSNPVTVYYKLATPTTVQLVPHLPVVRTGIKTLSVGADVVPTLSATVKSMD